MTITARRRAPLVRKGSPQAHALSVANSVTRMKRAYGTMRRKTLAEYGTGADNGLLFLLDRYEKRLDDLEITAEALRDHLLLHAPAPRDDTEDHWLCENPSCRVPLYGRKANTRSCSNACRAEVSRLRAAGILPPLVAAAGDAS